MNPWTLLSARSADAEGRFALERIAPGWYDLVASAPGLQAGVAEDLHLIAGEAGEEQELRLNRGAAITGRVLTPNGAPIPGAHLYALSEKSRQEGLAGPEGTFRLEGVETGKVLLLAMADHFEENKIEVEVTPGEAATDIVLQPEKDEDPIEVSGRVLSPDGSPVEGALVSVGGRSVSSERGGAFKLRICGCRSDKPLEVVAVKRGFATGRTTVLLDGERVEGVEVRLETGTEITGRVLGLDGPRRYTTITLAAPGRDGGGIYGDPVDADAEGRFRFGPIPAGTWEVQAHSGDRTAQAPVTLEPGQAEAYVELSFDLGQEVSGRILDPDGLPAAHATVFASTAAEEGYNSTWTHSDGTFSLRTLAGDVTLAINHRGLRRQHRLQVGDGGVAGVEIRLERGALLSGRVLGIAPGDQPMIDLEGAEPEFAQMAPDGSWSVEGISPGTWKLKAHLYKAEGVQVIRRTLEISPEASEVSVELDFTGVPLIDPEELDD